MNGDDNHVEEIIRICQEAAQQLLIAMPWWADDETGRRIRQEVETAAQRGIEVSSNQTGSLKPADNRGP